MNFRNLTMYRIPKLSASIPDALDGLLSECALKPVGPLELSSRGFVQPHGRDSEQFSHRHDSAFWLTVGGEDRLLPAAVVNEAVAKKLGAIRVQEGREPGGRTRKRLRDEVITDLLPRAFIKPSRVDVIIDLRYRIVIVDTSSRKHGEGVISEIRRALGSFPALPLNAEISPRSILTGWLSGEQMPDGLSIGDECDLTEPVDHGGKVRCTRQALEADEISKHLEAGKQVTRLGLHLDDHTSFVIGDDLVVRKFKLLDGAIDQLDASDRDGLQAELDARFALLVAEVRRLFDVMEPALKLSKVES